MPNLVRASSEPGASYQAIGAWQPDVPSPINDGMISALNLIPRANDTYGPELGPTDVGGTVSVTPFGDALKAHGSLHSRGKVISSSPEYYVGTFAVASGSSRLLGREEEGGWSDLSRTGGYDCRGITPWRFANFGAKVLAINKDTRLQVSDGELAQFGNMNADLRASDVATVRGFAVIIDVNDAIFGDGDQPFRVWWSAIGNAENFPDPLSDAAVTVQSGFFDLIGGGELQRVIPGVGGSDAIIIAERKIWRMSYVGAPAVWQFDEVESDQGTTVPGSVAVLNKTIFYLGQNGFYAFDGVSSQPIGQQDMVQFFNADLSLASTFAKQHQIEAGIDCENHCYVVAYRSQAAEDDHNDRVLRFNWITGKWSNSAIAADSLAHVDSFISATDAPRMVLIDSTFQIRHLDGATLETTIEGPELSTEDGARSMIRGVFLHCDAGAGALVSIATRENLDDTPDVSTERTRQNDGFVRWDDEQPSGRFYQCRIRIPAGTSWTNITGLIYDAQVISNGPRIGA